MNNDQLLADRACQIVQDSLSKFRDDVKMHHRGTSDPRMGGTPSEIAIWKLGKDYYSFLIIKEKKMILVGHPGLHTKEEFGSVNSLEFYLGAKGPGGLDLNKGGKVV